MFVRTRTKRIEAAGGRYGRESDPNPITRPESKRSASGESYFRHAGWHNPELKDEYSCFDEADAGTINESTRDKEESVPGPFGMPPLLNAARNHVGFRHLESLATKNWQPHGRRTEAGIEEARIARRSMESSQDDKRLAADCSHRLRKGKPEIIAEERRGHALAVRMSTRLPAAKQYFISLQLERRFSHPMRSPGIAPAERCYGRRQRCRMD